MQENIQKIAPKDDFLVVVRQCRLLFGKPLVVCVQHLFHLCTKGVEMFIALADNELTIVQELEGPFSDLSPEGQGRRK